MADDKRAEANERLKKFGAMSLEEAQKDATLPLKRTARTAVVLAVATVVLAVATMILALVTLATYSVL